jgi:hypothetical protein
LRRFAELLRPLFHRFGGVSERTVHTLATAVSLTAITFLHTVLGELAPKAIALQYTETIALWAAGRSFLGVTWRSWHLVLPTKGVGTSVDLMTMAPQPLISPLGQPRLERLLRQSEPVLAVTSRAV